MKKLLLLPVLLLLCAFTGVKANNIRVDGKTRVVSVAGDTAVIEVTLRWDNSWRDDFNWDAAWVFFKYKKRGLTNAWQHAYLGSSGHVLSTSVGNEGGGYSFMVGTNNGKVNGLYVMRNSISEGNVSVRLQAKWPLNGTGLTKSDFGDALNEIYVAVHAIEMVYIPYGAYYLGDAYSNKSFAVGDTSAVVIDSESAVTLSAKNGTPVALSASYPKGYAGFYVMKYETSQEQYVEFLNSLTLDQQKARVMNNDFAHMKCGNYVFGDTNRVNNRNGIVFIEQRQPNTPVVFGNNLNPKNDLFAKDDGQTLACNYMSVEDMIAYCSWSGLRPMSELEYEKACRRFYPQVPDKGEYAWNTNNGINRISSLSDLNFRGDEREQALSYLKNVNSGTGNGINGPVRCGLFATSATSQSQSGATYWGVMDMSGNLKELCANVNYTNLDGGSCGTGVYNANLWDKTVNRYGVRGGGFNSADDLLRTSDRTEAVNYFTAITQRDSTVGFRGVYSLSGIKIDGGEIRASKDTLCPGDEANIVNVMEASCPDMPDVRFQYTWYVKKPGEAKYELIPDVMGEDITYTHLQVIFQMHGTYQVKRNAICAVGMTESNEISITVPNIAVEVSPLSGTIDACGNVTTFMVTATGESIDSYDWRYETKNLSTVNNYKIDKRDFGDKVGTHTITCDVTFNNGCVLSSLPVTVHIPDIRISSNENVPVCGEYSFTDTRDGEIYCTVQVGKQCWMGANLRYTGVSHCLVGNPVNKEKYGVHYFWTVAMNGEAVSSANPSGVRGICPAGWHLPSVSEFNELIAACGGTSVAGAYMKSEMNMSLAGHGYGCRNAQLEVYGIYGSTENDGYKNGIRLQLNKNNQQAVINKYMGATSYPYSYRCLKD